MILSLDKFIEVIQADCVCLNKEKLQKTFGKIQIATLLFDSRMLDEAETSAFFAFKTKSNDGHKYISELYDKGVRVFVCTRLPRTKKEGAIYLKVPDTLKAMQALGAYSRRQFTGTLVAITGSNGKTTVKEFMRTLFAQDKKVYFSPMSYNSQIGVPVSLYQLDNSYEIGIFEAGISKLGEMDILREMLKPQIVAITNVGEAHGANFSSFEEKFWEKIKLTFGCKTVFCPRDDVYLYERLAQYCITIGLEIQTFRTREATFWLKTPFKDRINKANAMLAFLMCMRLGANERQMVERLHQLYPLEMRLQLKRSVGGSVVINDTYCLDLTSLAGALDFANTWNKRLRRCVILSDLQEKDEDMAKTMSRMNALLKKKFVNFLYGIGNDYLTYEDQFDIPHKFFASVEDFLTNVPIEELYQSAILIKGARSAGLERISNLLEKENHQSILGVNLTALSKNIKYFKVRAKEGVKIMAMVKADSYGCGGSEVAMELERSNVVDYLAVAFVDEGVRLRENGISLPIMVVTPEEEALEKMCEYNLEPVVHNFETLDLVKDLKTKIHIKLDTGMHRLGFEDGDLKEVIAIIKQQPNLRVASVFSHLACADDPESDDFTLEQLKRFDAMSEKIIKSFRYKIMRHVCNSAATTRFHQYQYDMVRVGIGMYGIGVDYEMHTRLNYVHRLQTKVSSIREIAEGESVSYMRRFIAQRPTKIGVIPIGYADGLNRKLSEKGFKVWVNGKLVPIVGTICMDMCMLDLTDVPVRVGDRVVIFGYENPVEDMAKTLDTIPYEIFTSISPRIKRVYYHE